MAQKFIIKQHDLEPSLLIRLLDGTASVDLTNAGSVQFFMRDSAGALTVNSFMAILDQTVLANKGLVAYHWALGDTATPGTYQCEIQVNWMGSRPQTFPVNKYFNVVVRPDLGP
jgi:hypothetical protein